MTNEIGIDSNTYSSAFGLTNPDEPLDVTFLAETFIAREAAEKNTVSFKTVYADMMDGDPLSGLWLSQLVYWHLPSKKDGNSKLRVFKNGHYWVAKEHKEWHEETRLSEKQVSRITSLAEEKSIVFVDHFRFAGLRTTHVRINWPVFVPLYLVTIKSPQHPKGRLP